MKKRVRLLKKGEFQRVLAGPRLLACAGFVAVATPTEREGRVGVGVSRNVKRAVKRNRVRRRLREAVRLGLLQEPPAGSGSRRLGIALDVVLIARPAAATLQFSQLAADMARLRSRLLAVAESTKGPLEPAPPAASRPGAGAAGGGAIGWETGTRGHRPVVRR